MQALKCASGKNNYPCQIQIILVNILTRAYNFKIERIPSNLKIFTQKNRRCYVYLPIPYNRPSLSRGHQTVTTMNHCCYCFDGLWNVKVKYIALCLNAFAKLQNVRGASCHPFFMAAARLVVIWLGPINLLNDLLLFRSR